MITGVGVDIVDIERFRASLERTPALQDRLFTTAEAQLPLESRAARFAAKEALAKAFGAPAELSWREIEVVTTPAGAPMLLLSGAAQAKAAELNVTTVHLSLSHDGSIATAFVVAEC